MFFRFLEKVFYVKSVDECFGSMMDHRVSHGIGNAKRREEALRPVDRSGWIHLR